MYIWTFFTDAGTPAIGLSPTVDAYDLSDNSKELDGVSMTNVASTGFYSYDASSLDLSKSIVFKADGGVALNGAERWKVGGLTSRPGIGKNIALPNFAFEMILSSDHLTPATGKTVTAKIAKDGGAFATCTNVVTEKSDGWYEIDFTKTEMNADVILLTFSASGCDTRGIVLKTSA